MNQASSPVLVVVGLLAGFILGVVFAAVALVDDGPSRAALIAWLKAKGLWSQVEKDLSSED